MVFRVGSAKGWLWRASNSRVLGVVTDAKGSMDPIPTWVRTDRWLAVRWQRIWTIFTERTDGSHWQRWSPNIQLAMERSMNDWMKAIGKQRFRRSKASPYAYMKFSPMNCISISILFYVWFRSFNYQNPITIWIRLTEIYKMTIASFKPKISVGLTLTHVRYYLDDWWADNLYAFWHCF